MKLRVVSAIFLYFLCCMVLLSAHDTQDEHLNQEELKIYYKKLISKCDINQDEHLNEEELTRFFLYYTEIEKEKFTKVLDKKIKGFIQDLLSSEKNLLKVPNEEVLSYLIIQTYQEKKKKHFVWPGLGFSRFVIDAVNPRQTKYRAPFIFSYRYNKESEKKDQYNFFGGLQLFHALLTKGKFDFVFTPGVDFDVDDSKDSCESSLRFGLPIFLMYDFGTNSLIESIILGFKPIFETDSDFKREIVELVFSFTFTSNPLGAGFFSPPIIKKANGRFPKFSFFWEPSLQLEVGSIKNAAGNEDLSTLEGKEYLRLVTRARLIFFPLLISERLRVVLDFFHRFDLNEKWDRGYAEIRLDYDLIAEGLIELSAVYRRGYKPPIFAEINEFLIGLGLRL